MTPEHTAIAEALSKIAEAVLVVRQAERATSDIKATMLTWHELMKPRVTLEDHVEPWLKRPVEKALILGIKSLGKTIAHHMTVDEMGDVAEAAAALNDRQYGRLISMIDHAWDGITDRDGARWVS